MKLDEDRLSQEELAQLRARLGATAPEAASVDDIAEAAGVDRSQVHEHLRQLRAEKAFSEKAQKQRSQIGLLVLAIAMFGVAAKIWQVRQPEDLDAKQAEIMAKIKERRAKRLRENPPPDVKIPKSVPRPPAGFTVDLSGYYKRLKYTEPPGNALPLASRAQRQLAESLSALITLLAEAEQNRGPFAKPIERQKDEFQYTPWVRPTPGRARIQVQSPGGGTESFVYLVPQAGQTEESLRFAWQQLANSMAKSAVDAVLRNQEAFLTQANEATGGPTMPPPGYGITVKGRFQTSTRGHMLTLAPFKYEGLEPTLRTKILELIVQSRKDPATLYGMSRTGNEKRPLPAYTVVEIQGPLETLKFEVPSGISDRYPTMADALRGTDAIVAAKAAEAARQIERINQLALVEGS